MGAVSGGWVPTINPNPDPSTGPRSGSGAGSGSGGRERCARPVRLAGHVDQVDVGTGEMRRTFDSSSLPDGVLHVGCRNRRATACPACSALYKGDARTLVLAGLVGGRTVPGGVVGHPALFVTLTAPSFGPVHSQRLRPDGGPARACHPRRGICPHGRPAGCHLRHAPDDAQLGEPICPECFDYLGAVVWNALVSRLWSQTRRAVIRHLAGAVGLSLRQARAAVRVASVRVVEMQARGLVHVHTVIRLDGAGGPGDPPPPWADGELLAGAVRADVTESAVACPLLLTGQRELSGEEPDTLDGVVRWGGLLDVSVVRSDAVDRLGNYLAKYLTKSVDGGGLLDRPIRSVGHLRRLGLRPHPERLAFTAWTLGHDPVLGPAVDRAAGRTPRPGSAPARRGGTATTPDGAGRAGGAVRLGGRCGLARWAHSYGYGGHWVAKTQGYSTTFGALRAERAAWARTPRGGEDPADVWGRPLSDGATVTVTDWRYAGRGYPPTPGGAR